MLRILTQLGFTLIELMIVVALISILTSIAIPSYRHYTERARFTEIFTAVEPYKIAVALAKQAGIPSEELNNGEHDIPEAPPATKNLHSLTVTHGVITATASALLQNATYILKLVNNDNVWSISGTCQKYNYCKD